MKSIRRMIRKVSAKQVVFGVVAAAALFGAGYLAAGGKADSTAPQTRFLIPEGYTVENVYPVGNTIQVRARDAAGDQHVFVYRDGKGDQKIRWHSVVAKVPAAEAFAD